MKTFLVNLIMLIGWIIMFQVVQSLIKAIDKV
jgi:hypothetical protein